MKINPRENFGTLESQKLIRTKINPVKVLNREPQYSNFFLKSAFKGIYLGSLKVIFFTFLKEYFLQIDRFRFGFRVDEFMNYLQLNQIETIRIEKLYR